LETTGILSVYYKINLLNWALKKQALRVLCDLCALCGLNLLGPDSIIRSHDEQIITAKLTKGIKLILRN